MQIEQFFPTNISNSFCPFHNEIQERLIDHCFSISKTIKKSDNIFQNNGQLYTTYGTHDILLDEKFERLNSWIKNEVKKYVDTLRMKVNLKYEGNAFFNIYKKHDYQETHDHAGSMISCIYFLKSNEKSSRVFFKSRMHSFNSNIPKIRPIRALITKSMRKIIKLNTHIIICIFLKFNSSDFNCH